MLHSAETSPAWRAASAERASSVSWAPCRLPFPGYDPRQLERALGLPAALPILTVIRLLLAMSLPRLWHQDWEYYKQTSPPHPTPPHPRLTAVPWGARIACLDQPWLSGSFDEPRDPEGAEWGAREAVLKREGSLEPHRSTRGIFTSVREGTWLRRSLPLTCNSTHFYPASPVNAIILAKI